MVLAADRKKLFTLSHKLPELEKSCELRAEKPSHSEGEEPKADSTYFVPEATFVRASIRSVHSRCYIVLDSKAREQRCIAAFIWKAAATCSVPPRSAVVICLLLEAEEDGGKKSSTVKHS